MNMLHIHLYDCHPLHSIAIKRLLPIFLCDDAVEPIRNLSILSHSHFCPDSFFLHDRLHSPDFLDQDEHDFYQHLSTLVSYKLERLQQESSLYLTSSDAIHSFCLLQVIKFLNFQINSKPIMGILLNQELRFVLDKVISYCLFGDPHLNIETHKSFNLFALRVMPFLLEKYFLCQPMELKQLLLYSIASGIVGCDLKSRSTLAEGIPLFPLFEKNIEDVGINIKKGLDHILTSRPLLIDYWEAFVQEVLVQPCRLCGFLMTSLSLFLTSYSSANS